jgi:hypothetical protein
MHQPLVFLIGTTRNDLEGVALLCGELGNRLSD